MNIRKYISLLLSGILCLGFARAGEPGEGSTITLTNEVTCKVTSREPFGKLGMQTLPAGTTLTIISESPQVIVARKANDPEAASDPSKVLLIDTYKLRGVHNNETLTLANTVEGAFFEENRLSHEIIPAGTTLSIVPLQPPHYSENPHFYKVTRTNESRPFLIARNRVRGTLTTPSGTSKIPAAVLSLSHDVQKPIVGAGADSGNETIPAGTVVSIVSENPSSFMVTRTNEYKPFFLEKNQRIQPKSVVRGPWKITTIDPSAYKNWGRVISTVIHNGSPVVAYYSQSGLSLATRSPDGQWLIELIDAAMGPPWEGGSRPGGQISLALDSSGQPHIAYNPECTSLLYAKKTDHGWTSQLIHDEWWPIEDIKMTCTNGSLVIGYTTHGKIFSDSWNGTNWISSSTPQPQGDSAPRKSDNSAPDLVLKKGNPIPDVWITNSDGSFSSLGTEVTDLFYKNKTNEEFIDAVLPGTAMILNQTNNPTIVFVGWKGDPEMPQNSQGLKIAERIQPTQPPTGGAVQR